jgi:hypothetical protein
LQEARYATITDTRVILLRDHRCDDEVDNHRCIGGCTVGSHI